jgi:hypothetical protein
MPKPITFNTGGWVGTNTTFRAYVKDDATGSFILAAAVSSIAYTVKQAAGPSQGTTTGSGGLTPVSTYLLAALSTVGWTVDAIGYNFKAALPASCFPDAGDYVIDFVFTLAADGSTFPVKCYHHARSRN